MSEFRFKTLYDAIDETKAKTLIEIGVYRCERSREMIAKALQYHKPEDITFHGFDLFEFMNPAYQTLEVSRSGMPRTCKEAFDYLTRLFPGVKINLYPGDSKLTLPGKNIPFDIAFIDGGHSYKTTKSDWKYISRIMKPGSIVCFDDYSAIPGVFTTQVVEELDKKKYSIEISDAFDMSTPAYGSVKLHIAKIKKR